jgi:LysR family cys regulon transcriptional activator
VLPEPVAQLRKRHPKVHVSLHQGNPEQVAQMLIEESADIGLATESLSDFDELVTQPCYEWQHMIVVPAGHPLAAVDPPTLEQLAAEPLESYHPSFTGRTRIDHAFAQRRLKPNIVLEAIDSDVFKTYVKLGLGVGIVAEMAAKDDPGTDLVWRPAGHLFGRNVSRVAFKRGAYLRNFVYTFAELLSDRLTKALIMRVMSGEAAAPDYQL